MVFADVCLRFRCVSNTLVRTARTTVKAFNHRRVSTNQTRRQGAKEWTWMGHPIYFRQQNQRLEHLLYTFMNRTFLVVACAALEAVHREHVAGVAVFERVHDPES